MEINVFDYVTNIDSYYVKQSDPEGTTPQLRTMRSLKSVDVWLVQSGDIFLSIHVIHQEQSFIFILGTPMNPIGCSIILFFLYDIR